jgi:hypothetical protein
MIQEVLRIWRGVRLLRRLTSLSYRECLAAIILADKWIEEDRQRAAKKQRA